MKELDKSWPTNYFKNLASLFMISWAMIFPDWLAQWVLATVVDSLEFMVGTDTVHFTKNMLMPRITAAVKNVKVPLSGAISLGRKWIGSFLKIALGFVWVEQFYSIPWLHLYDEWPM